MRSPIYSNLEPIRQRPLLSILICTIQSRAEYLKELLDELNHQIQFSNVQVLWLGDNKSMSVGTKRNALLSIAEGEWICFIDDDDLPTEDYIKDLMNVIDTTDKKVVTFLAKKDGDPTPYRFSREYAGVHKTVKLNGNNYHGYLPGHLNVWRKDFIDEWFDDKNVSEDHQWAYKMAQKITVNDQHFIDRVLYHYRFNINNSLTKNR